MKKKEPHPLTGINPCGCGSFEQIVPILCLQDYLLTVIGVCDCSSESR